MINYIDILKNADGLESENLKLRRFHIKDIEDVYEYAKDEKTVEYLTWEKAENLEDIIYIINNIYNDLGVFAIELKKEKKCIGCIEMRLDNINDKISFGYVLNREYWNRGYMTEALEILIELSFEKLGINKVESTHYRGNEGSGKVMEKAGMKLEGIIEDELYIKGKYRDIYHYGMTKERYYKFKNKGKKA